MLRVKTGRAERSATRDTIYMVIQRTISYNVGYVSLASRYKMVIRSSANKSRPKFMSRISHQLFPEWTALF